MSKTNANNLTKQLLTVLEMSGFTVWRQNNIPVKGRKFIGRKGVPDIIGFRRNCGTFIGVEIKVGKDKLSEAQEQFLEELREAGGMAFVAGELNRFVKELRAEIEKLKDKQK